MMHRCIAISTAALLLVLLWPSVSQAQALAKRGQEIADGLCSRCHAIGKTGESPLPAAPRFRSLDSQTNLSKLSRRIQEGLLTGHEDMPMFRFDRDDADAMVAYIRSVQVP
jgi:mono/diheme cytochrome c family protein